MAAHVHECRIDRLDRVKVGNPYQAFAKILATIQPHYGIRSMFNTVKYIFEITDLTCLHPPDKGLSCFVILVGMIKDDEALHACTLYQ